MLCSYLLIQTTMIDKEFIFMGRTFYGDPSKTYQTNELSKHLIQQVSEYINTNNLHQWIMVDVGTGSWSLTITLAKIFPQATIYAVDNSPTALEECKRNIIRHECRNIVLCEGKYVDTISVSPDVIFASLPYGNEELLTPWNTMEHLSLFPSGSYFHSSWLPFASYDELIKSIVRKWRNVPLFIETGIMSQQLIANQLDQSIDRTYYQWNQEGFSTVKINFHTTPNVHQHLIYSAVVNRTPILENEWDILLKFLQDTVQTIDMKILIEPTIAFSHAKARTGLVGIITSHISFHYRTMEDINRWIKPFVQLDIYSCKRFDTEKAIKFLDIFRQASDVTTIVLDRSK